MRSILGLEKKSAAAVVKTHRHRERTLVRVAIQGQLNEPAFPWLWIATRPAVARNDAFFEGALQKRQVARFVTRQEEEAPGMKRGGFALPCGSERVDADRPSERLLSTSHRFLLFL